MDNYQCSTLHAANGFQFKIPSIATWPRVAIKEMGVLTNMLSCKYPSLSSAKNYVPIFRESYNVTQTSAPNSPVRINSKEMDNVGSPKVNFHSQDDSDPSSSEEIKENEKDTPFIDSLVQEKEKLYKLVSFNTFKNKIPESNPPKELSVKVSASSFSSKKSFTSSLLFNEKNQECSSAPVFHFSTQANEEVFLQLDIDFPFENCDAKVNWSPDNQTVKVFSFLFKNVSKKIFIDPGKLKFFPLNESIATQIEISFFHQNKLFFYRLPILFDVLQSQQTSRTFALVVCLDKESHLASNSIKQLRSSNVNLFYLIGSQEATKNNVDSSLDKISSLLKPNDSFHFYYFGHVHHPTILCK